MIVFPFRLNQIYRYLYRNIKISSLVGIILGLLLFCSAAANRWKWLVEILGIITIIEGIIGFLMPATSVKALMNWWFKNGPGIKRIWGFLTVTMGIIILWGVL